jgi:hypothetical protein
MGYLSGHWYVKELKELKVAQKEELLMLRLMQVAGNGIRLMLKPTKVQGVKVQEICGLTDNELQVSVMIKELVYGYSVEWAGDTRVMITGKADLLQKQKLQRSAQSLATHKQEGAQTDTRELVLKPLARQTCCRGRSCRGVLRAWQITGRRGWRLTPGSWCSSH